jgi:hypothetical protein
MATQVYKPRFGPAKVPDQPTEEAMKIIRGNLEDLHAAAAYFKLIIDGEVSGAVDHGLLAGLGDDDHTQYLLLANRAGGQIIQTVAAADVTLSIRGTTSQSGDILRIQSVGGVDTWLKVAADGQTTLTSSTSAGVLNLPGNTGGTVLKIGTSPSLSWTPGGSAITATLAGSNPHLTWAGASSKMAFSGVTLIDSGMFIGATADITKRLTWDLSGATTGKTLTIAPVHANNRTVTVPDGGGNYTLAGLQIAQTFTKAQTITPDSDAIGLTINDYSGGQTAAIFSIAETGVSNMEYQPGAGALGLQGLHLAGNTAGGIPGFFLWPSGQIGVGTGVQKFASAATTAVTFTFPNINGLGLVRAAALNRLASTTGVATNTATLLGAGAAAGEYQINLVVSTGTTAGDRVFKFELLWRDEQADAAATDRVLALSQFTVAAFVSSPANIGQYTGAIWHSGTTAIRIRSSLVSGTTGNYDLHIRANATG